MSNYDNNVFKNNNITEFANKINSKETNKIYEKIKLRNRDFGYECPDNEEEYKEELNSSFIWYLVNNNYLDINIYYENWKEDMKLDI